MDKIILIEKYNPNSGCWPYLEKNIALPGISVDKIVSTYQGFEGELISMSSQNENRLNLSDLAINEHFLLLHVISGSGATPSFLKRQGYKCGYDVGVCEREKTIYSSIFNEILFGHIPELVSFHQHLNENLLFSNRDLAEEYVDIHNLLSAEGKGVEDYEEMIIYEIWKENLS